MQNFVLHNPTTILFGTDTVKNIGAETAAFGKKILLVYGKNSIKKNGIYDRVKDALEKQSLEIIEHGGVQSNPLLSHVRKGIAKAREANTEVIVAVGGGSVIDSAKAISAGALVDHDVWQFFKGKKSIKKTLPLTCVLTLAAAGSEMNGGMVITHDEKKHKFGVGNRLLNPKVSILDPTLTYSVPPDYTAYGAVDAIAHILEFYFTTTDPSTPVQDRFMEGLVINIMESCEKVLADPEDYQGRADLMWCATLALNGWTAAGLGMVGFPMHMIEHSLSALYNVAHGAGLSIVVPGWMRYQAERNPKKFAQFADRVFGISGENPKNAALQGIERLKEWFVSVKSPVSLSEASIPAQEISSISENALSLAKMWRLKEYKKENIMEILKLCC
ncbi:MAG: iron-containing alcohol dehydrogenase [Desulfobulbaceae bacterium]|nr:iron-containing alcohol dehydrogenase [Desulfobulbaceae bacterium]